MRRIAEFDLPSRLAPTVPPWLTAVGVGLACAALSFLVRLALDLIAPGSAPFALLFPTITLATLFAGWLAGSVTAGLSTVYIVTFLYPLGQPPPQGGATAAVNVVVVVVASAALIAIAEAFRRAARHAAAERDREIAERDLFLAEVDHRMKNNFAVVASLLDLQRRRSAEPATQEALSAAIARVESIARAHRHLYRDASADAVEMHDYLEELCAALADALFLHGTIQLSCVADRVRMPRDRAVSIGLVLNELVTNAVKHAFVGRDRGEIDVRFRNDGRGLRLSVSDDGGGIVGDASPRADGGLGQRLIEAFARQAGGRLTIDSDRTGTRATLELDG